MAADTSHVASTFCVISVVQSEDAIWKVSGWASGLVIKLLWFMTDGHMSTCPALLHWGTHLLHVTNNTVQSENNSTGTYRKLMLVTSWLIELILVSSRISDSKA